jgi:hypothetical protein
MAKKTVLRALLKALLQSSELAEILKRDDEADYSDAADEQSPRRGRPRLAASLKVIAENDPPKKPEPRHDDEPVDEPEEFDDDPIFEDAPDQDDGQAGIPHNPQTGEILDPVEDDEPEIAIDRSDADYQRGQTDRRNGVKKLISQAIKGDPVRMAHWKAGYDDADANG